MKLRRVMCLVILGVVMVAGMSSLHFLHMNIEVRAEEKSVSNSFIYDWENDSIVIADNITSVALDDIVYKDKVKTITLSNDLGTLLVDDFTSRLHDFPNLEQIYVPLENNYFTVWKGGLYNKEKTVFYGFPQKTKLTTMEFPEEVKSIELRNNIYPNIEKVILPDTFDRFYTHEGGGFQCFNEMFPKLKSVQISSKCKTYKSLDGVVFTKSGKKLILYPNQKLGDKYTIAKEVNKMYAFIKCLMLKTIIINKNLVCFYPFEDTNISKFKTVKDCKNFVTKDGVLYNKKLTELKAYPPSKKSSTYKVPDSVKNILCLQTENIQKLVLGKKVKYIGNLSFIKNLTNISISRYNPNFKVIDAILCDKDGNPIEGAQTIKAKKI